MKEITEYFDRLLWFVYRVFFTLLPSVLFISFITAFTVYLDLISLKSINSLVTNLSFFYWTILFAVIFSMNLILESLTNLITYDLLSFKKTTKEEFNRDESLSKLLTKYNPDMLEIIKNNDRITLETSIFNFGLLKSNSESIWFNNYVWFLISREYLLSNLSLIFMISSIVFLPYIMHDVYKLNLIYSIILQVFQFVIVVCIYVFSFRLIRIKYGNDRERYMSSKRLLKLYIIPLVMLVFAIIGLFNSKTEVLSIFIVLDLLLLFTVSSLLLRTMREYIHVEFIILTSLAKDIQK